MTIVFFQWNTLHGLIKEKLGEWGDFALHV